MKKIVLIVLVLAMLLSLVGCHTYLFGEYTNAESGKKYDFINNTFTLYENDKEVSGTYSIKKGSIVFVVDEIEEVFSYKRDGAAVLFDGMRFERAN